MNLSGCVPLVTYYLDIRFHKDKIPIQKGKIYASSHYSKGFA